MKYLTILLSTFTFTSCGNSKEVTAMEANKETMTQISGIYYVSTIGENNHDSDELTIQFEEQSNTVSGFLGCNRFTGTYTLDGNSISFGPLATTRMMCEEANNKMEQNMLSALENTTSINIENQELSLSNSKGILIKATKNSELKVAQENNYIIEYTAVSRGLFNQYIFENGTLSIQKDRSSAPTMIACSKEDSNAIIEQVKTLDLEKLKTLEAPTERRFVDAAAIATLKVIYNGETYETPNFDNGEPNKYIVSLVSTLMELIEKQ